MRLAETPAVCAPGFKSDLFDPTGRVVGISFLKAAILTLTGACPPQAGESNAPWLVFRGSVQAKKVNVAAAGLLWAVLPMSPWGRPGMNFNAKLPFYGMA